MTRALARTSLLFMIPLLLVVAFGMLMSAHVHREAPHVRSMIDQRAGDPRCPDRPDLFYSIGRGMLLIITKLDDGLTGGQIFKITEIRNQEVMPSDKMYESTCFAAPESYWDRVIFRDGYISLSEAKITVAGVFLALGIVCTMLRRIGRGNLADCIEDA